MAGGDHGDVIRQWIAAYNNRDREAEAAVRTPGYVAHFPGMPGPLDGDSWTGLIFSFVEAFPDLELTVEETVSQGDRVAARVTFRGTHRGAFQGIPATGREVRFTSIEYNRMEGDKVAEHWVELDQLGLLQQLGAIPPAATD